jgi:hypothetical protein
MHNISAIQASMSIYQKYVVDLEYDTSWANQTIVDNKTYDIQTLSNRVHNDGLVTDPYWINGVNYHASYSRQNYRFDLK